MNTHGLSLFGEGGGAALSHRVPSDKNNRRRREIVVFQVFYGRCRFKHVLG